MLQDSDLELEHVLFEGNEANHGGGARLQFGDDGWAGLNNVAFIDNNSSGLKVSRTGSEVRVLSTTTAQPVTLRSATPTPMTTRPRATTI